MLPHIFYLLSVAVCFVPLPLDVQFSESFQLQGGGVSPPLPLTRGSAPELCWGSALKPPYRLALCALRGQGPSAFLDKFTPMKMYN